MNEQKKVTVISVTGNGSFSSQYGDENGLLYSFIYTLENEQGQTGEFHVNHKTPEAKFKEGEEVEFEEKGQDQKGNKKAKLSNVGSGSYSSNTGYQKKSTGSNASFALAYAKDYHTANGVDGNIVEVITATATGFLEWLNDN